MKFQELLILLKWAKFITEMLNMLSKEDHHHKEMFFLIFIKRKQSPNLDNGKTQEMRVEIILVWLEITQLTVLGKGNNQINQLKTEIFLKIIQQEKKMIEVQKKDKRIKHLLKIFQTVAEI